MSRSTGARGLRAIIEKAMMNIMYEIPSDDRVKSVYVTKESIADGADPELTYREEGETKSRSHKTIKKNDEIA